VSNLSLPLQIQGVTFVSSGCRRPAHAMSYRTTSCGIRLQPADLQFAFKRLAYIRTDLFSHCRYSSMAISNNSSFRLKHPGVPDGSDGSGGTSYPLTENQTRPVAQATGRVAYLPCGGYYTMPLILAKRRVVYYARLSGVRLPLLCVRNVVTYTHHQNDTYVTLFAGVAVMQ
jgi:hypothetical protein